MLNPRDLDSHNPSAKALAAGTLVGNMRAQCRDHAFQRRYISARLIISVY